MDSRRKETANERHLAPSSRQVVTDPPRLQLVPSRTQPALRSHSPLILWHLLSLDAPSVATLWVVFLGWSAGVRLSIFDPLAMFVAVWMLYAADRLLDARPFAAALAPLPELEDRHRFHDAHRPRFVTCLAAAAVPLALLLYRLSAPALHLYVLLVSLLAGWLLLVHAQPAPAAGTRRLPKELAVGLFFPAAVYIPTVARAPELRLALMPGALLFAGVCTLNCLFLYAWEHPFDHSRAHATTRWALRRLVSLALVLLAASVTLLMLTLPKTFAGNASMHWAALPHAAVVPAACALSLSLLLLLHFQRHRLPDLSVRALADLALLTPLPLLLLASLGATR